MKIPDINMYKIFRLNGKYGIKRWDGLLIVNPIMVKRPDVVELEVKGYTFVSLEYGCNIIDCRGNLLINDLLIKNIGWFKEGEIVAFEETTGFCGLYFLKTRKIITGLVDAECEEHFILTMDGEHFGVTTYNGQEIFKPLYYEPTIFHDNIYIAFNQDGTAILNCPEWSEPLHAKAFKRMQTGVVMKDFEDEFAWVNLQTGKKIPEGVLTRAQKQMLAFAKLVKSF